MKKRVIQINGFSGILMILFIITCLIAGFVCFPAIVCTNIWNYAASKLIMVNTISFWGGLLLWGIIALSFFLLKKRRFVVSFGVPGSMTKDELSELFRRAEFEKPEEVLKEFENKHSKTHSENK